MSEAFEDWFHQEYNQFYSHDSFMDIDIREAFQAGRAYQREVDAGRLLNRAKNDPLLHDCTPCGALMQEAKAIREQKID